MRRKLAVGSLLLVLCATANAKGYLDRTALTGSPRAPQLDIWGEGEIASWRNSPNNDSSLTLNSIRSLDGEVPTRATGIGPEPISIAVIALGALGLLRGRFGRRM